jgi:hypothetical protein
MTTPRISEMPILRTESEVLQRVSDIVGAATTDRRLWIMFLDGDGGVERRSGHEGCSLSRRQPSCPGRQARPGLLVGAAEAA